MAMKLCEHGHAVSDAIGKPVFPSCGCTAYGKAIAMERSPRNSSKLTFGSAVDKLEALDSELPQRLEMAAAQVREHFETMRSKVLDRCDPEVRARVLEHMGKNVR